MTGLLEERIAVVTGGGSGIGRAIALGYAREGAQIAILDCNGDTAAETVQAITGGGGRACSFILDVTSAARLPRRSARRLVGSRSWSTTLASTAATPSLRTLKR
jgi:NAD(P)-dependent dehydrogenase (short-subunit alcohol dehydrogenase family)